MAATTYKDLIISIRFGSNEGFILVISDSFGENVSEELYLSHSKLIKRVKELTETEVSED